MTRSSNRRAAALLASAAGAAGLVLAGCSAGQIAETARKNPSIPGANAEAQLRDDGRIVGSVAVRDVVVAYNDPEGYAGGDDAPLSLSIFNDTPEAVQVRVSVGRPPADAEQAVGADSVELVGGAEPTTSPSEPPPVASPSGTPGAEASPEATAEASPGAEPTASAQPQGQPAVIEIAAGSFAVLGPDRERHLRLVGLSDELRSGQTVPLVFEFSNGLELRVNAPMSFPLTPVPRGSPEIEELQGGH